MKIVAFQLRQASVTSCVSTEPLNAVLRRRRPNELIDFYAVSKKILPSVRMSLTKVGNVVKIQIERGRSAPATEPSRRGPGFNERPHRRGCGGAPSNDCHA